MPPINADERQALESERDEARTLVLARYPHELRETAQRTLAAEKEERDCVAAQQFVEDVERDLLEEDTP